MDSGGGNPVNDRPPDRCPRCGEATGGGEVCQSCGVSLSGNRPAPKTQSSGGMAPKAGGQGSYAAAQAKARLMGYANPTSGPSDAERKKLKEKRKKERQNKKKARKNR